MLLNTLRCKEIQNLCRTSEAAIEATPFPKTPEDKKTSFGITENNNSSVTESLPEGACNSLTITPKDVVLPPWHSVSSRSSAD